MCAPLSVGAAKCVRAGELLRRCACSVKWESNSIICVFAFHVNLEICGGQLKDTELCGEVTPIVEKIEEDEKGYNINKKHRVSLMYVCSFVS